MQASIAAYQTALLTLNGEVAQTYFEVRTTDELIRIVTESIKLHRDTVDLFRARRVDGLSSDIVLSDVETALRTTEAQVQTLEAQRIKLVNKLAVLTSGPTRNSLRSASNPHERSMPICPGGFAVGPAAASPRCRAGGARVAGL